MSKLVTAWDTRTGKVRQVPENWFDHEEMSTNLSRTDPKIPVVAPEGVNQVTRPDDRDYATAEELAAAGELKGQELKDALKAAGLPQTGSADEQRAALAAHDGTTTTDSTNGDTNTGAPQPGEK